MTAVSRIPTKCINLLSEAFRSVFNRYLFLPWVKFGRSVRFLGPIQCFGVRGEISVGARTVLGRDISLSVTEGGTIQIGEDCSVNFGTIISARHSVKIGNRVRVGELCGIRDSDHRIDGQESVVGSGYKVAPVTIGDDAWIGRCATIMPGVSIGKGAVVGAGSLVNKDVPDFNIVAGIPAKLIRVRQ